MLLPEDWRTWRWRVVGVTSGTIGAIWTRWWRITVVAGSAGGNLTVAGDVVSLLPDEQLVLEPRGMLNGIVTGTGTESIVAEYIEPVASFSEGDLASQGFPSG